MGHEPEGPKITLTSDSSRQAHAVALAAQQKSQQSQDQSQTPDRNSSVAEAARQERARKQNQQKKTRHVYTAEDLDRERILTPEDRAEFEARKSQQTAAPAGPPKLEDGVSGATVAQDAHAASPSANSAEVSLGDPARRSRRERESRQLQRFAEFPLPFADAPLLASPRPSAQPLTSFCDRGSSPGSCACSASDRSVAAVRGRD